ncbi:MAG TPA: DUF58 domain-containing protein [Gemmatimonadaceae bacterium]|nr:DUF58 domain-containing protein [Gemmatimonadaceae bacterium]
MSALSPTAVAAIDDLELAARLVVDGIRSGGHRSPSRGYSAEFQQHRFYRPGDDLKYLDWKILARSDRLYTKQFRETTNMSVMLVLDASASMAFSDEGVSKFQYATIVAAALAYLIVGQGDGVGLMTMEGGALSYLPAKGGRPHLRSLIAHIERLRPAGQWQPDRVIARGAELLKRRGVVLAISDFYDAEDDTRRALRRVARRGHDVAMVQVVTPEETAFPYGGDLQFEDLESGERRLIDAAAVQRQYRLAVGDFLDRCRTEAHRDGIDYALMPTDTPPDRALRGFLLRRGARHLSRYTARRS